MSRTTAPALPAELLAALATLLVLVGKLIFELHETLLLGQRLGLFGPDLTWATHFALLRGAILRPAFLMQCLTTYPLVYLPLHLLTRGIGALASPSSDLTGGSIAQSELEHH